MANRIGTPCILLCVIVVAADITLIFSWIWIESWIERQPRTWILIYFSNYYFCRVIVIFLISPKFKSTQSSILIVLGLIQERRINFSSVIRFAVFLHFKRIPRLVSVC